MTSRVNTAHKIVTIFIHWIEQTLEDEDPYALNAVADGKQVEECHCGFANGKRAEHPRDA
jgi:hypothetical protein